MRRTTVNKKVAVTPFVSTSTKVETKNGIPQIKQRAELTRLQVVFEGDGYERGQYVYVRGDACKHTFAGEVYEVDGAQFVLLPQEMVVMVEEK